MQDELFPGFKPVFHTGRVSGAFDLRAPDMQQVGYDRRVMLVLVADVTEFQGKTVKGDPGVFWKFKGVDAGIVRDEATRDRLSEMLRLDGFAPTFDTETGEVFPSPEPGVERFVGVELRDDEPDDLGPDDEDEEPEPTIEVQRGGARPSEGAFSRPSRATEGSPERVLVPGGARPIQSRDKALEAFLNEGG